MWMVTFMLAGCGSKAQAAPPISTSAPATQTSLSTQTATPVPFTPTRPDPTANPSIFGAIGTGEIQAFALESVANAIFTKTMYGLVLDGRIQEYQVTSVSIFPGGDGLLSEIVLNVRTTDPVWIAEGGTPANDNWFNGKCYRFDFVTTETEYQLKNRRLCG